MRFLLINPFCPIAEGPTPPLGISYLAAVLEEAGFQVKVLDLVITPYQFDEFSELLMNFKPDIVGSTAVTMTFNDAIKVIKDVKKIDPGIITVMGGPHVSFCAEETLNTFPELDLIVIGEGEETIVELSLEVEGDRDWSKIKGLVYRSDTGVLFTGNRELLDVDQLPLPARHLIPMGRYKALNTAVSMTTSRGCPFKCIFCVGRKMVGGKVRYRNPQYVVDEFEYLASLGFPQINIADDLFTAKTEHCLEICNEIIRRGIKTRWSSFARVDRVSADVLIKMKEAGCHAVSFGVETANEEILKTIKKGITLPKVINAINLCVDAGVEPHVSFILGLPNETPETLKETVDFGKKIDALGASYGFHLLAPFPGTAVRDEREKYDIKVLTDDWSQYHANRAIVETSKVDKEMLDAIALEWDRGTKEKLGEIQRKMTRGEASEDEAFQIINLERFLFIYDLMMNRVIEKNGCWRNGKNQAGSESEAISDLAERIYEATAKSKSETIDILKYACKKGSLSYANDEDFVRWQWSEFL